MKNKLWETFEIYEAGPSAEWSRNNSVRWASNLCKSLFLTSVPRNIAVKSVVLLTEIDDDDIIYYYQNQPGHEF